jgi:hypothetical protein
METQEVRKTQKSRNRNGIYLGEEHVFFISFSSGKYWTTEAEATVV